MSTGERRTLGSWASLLSALSLADGMSVPVWGSAGAELPPASTYQAQPSEASAMDLGSRVRSDDAGLLALLRDGHRDSETFRSLIAAIDVTDGIIYVKRGRCPLRNMRGCLPHFVNRAGGARYLFVILAHDLADDARVISVIGHELRHALEILQEPWILDSDDVFTHYRIRAPRQTVAAAGRVFETTAAQNDGDAILMELWRARRSADIDGR